MGAGEGSLEDLNREAADPVSIGNPGRLASKIQRVAHRHCPPVSRRLPTAARRAMQPLWSGDDLRMDVFASEPSMSTTDLRRSPFFSGPFLNRLRKMIPTARGPMTLTEQEIEGALHRIPDEPPYIRKLWVSDQPAFRNHLLRLDFHSRHDRFGMGVSDDFIANYAELCFRMRGSLFGYFPDDEMRGASELRLIGDQGTAAEAAFSVEPGWRRRGVGKELMARIVRGASNAQVTTLYMSCLASNRAMQELARHFEAEIKFEADQVTGRMIGRPPTAASRWEEKLDDAASLATSLVELHRRREEGP
jgi:GNAT superfamily N-acetyltransferase